MGLDQFTQPDPSSDSSNQSSDDKPDTSSNTSSGSTRSSNDSGALSSGHPHLSYKWVSPEVVIKRTDSSYMVVRYPDTESFQVFETFNSPPDDVIPSDYVYVWWTKESFQAMNNKVRNHVGESLEDLLSNAPPKRVVESIRDTVRHYDETQHRNKQPDYVNCAVCDERMHKQFGKWEKVNRRVVCPNHTVTELQQNGIL